MLGVVVSLTVSLLLLQVGVARAQVAESFRDDFGAISYGGNDGSATWSGSWGELGESDGPTAGLVQVVASDRCLGGAGNCLRIGHEGGDLANDGVAREADLSDATSATLSFHYRRQLQGKPAGSASIQVSGNGGSSWATVGSIALNGPQSPSSASYDISPHTGARTIVRIRVSGQAVSGHLFVDGVEIAAVLSPASTTTTTTASTTTTTKATTTTTTASTTTTTKATTTTTTGPSPSTTVGSGSSTTSTIADSSTTSPGGTEGSTTAPPGTASTDDPPDATVDATAGSDAGGVAGSTGAEATEPAGTHGEVSPGTQGSGKGDAAEPPSAMADEPGGDRGEGSPDPGSGETTLMAVAADAAVDAALPGIVLIAVVAALAVLGVAPGTRPADSGETPVEVEPPHGDG